MGRPSKIENHPKRQYIIEAIIEGKESYRNIGKRFDISASAVLKYKNTYLAENLSKVIAIKAIGKKEAVENQCNETAANQLQNIMGLMYKQLAACDAYLSDPEDPTKYSLDPRAWECDVVYLDVDPDTGRSTRKRESMQRIIDQMNERNINPVEIKMNQEDPRKLILSTATVLTKQLELIAKIEGIIKDTTVNVTVNQQWQQIEQVIYEATENAPEVRKKIVERLAG